MLTGFMISFPSLAEQRAIATYLDEMTERMDRLRSDAQRAIDLARERRAALISAAVTGQIDVTQKHRPVAEQLEDEVKQQS